MKRRLPPLKALMAFEAAARHLSITRAADELCVTPAAISHHIKQLQNWLQVPLFRRVRSNLALTDAGRVYLESLRFSLDEIAAATDQVVSRSRKNLLTLIAPPSFTMKWLLPRLHGFRESYPDIELALSVSAALTDCTHESADVAIHYGTGDYADMDAMRLAEVELFPACSPYALRGGQEAPETIDDLAQHTLLHDDALRLNERKDWRYWLQSAGCTDLKLADCGMHFNQAAIAYEEAIEGHGIALAKSVLVSNDLEQRRLLRPFAHSCATGFYYWAICRPSKAGDEKVKAFRDWLAGEFELGQRTD